MFVFGTLVFFGILALVGQLQCRNNRPLHGFRRHLGCGAVVAKITVNIWDIVQISTPITPQLYIRF